MSPRKRRWYVVGVDDDEKGEKTKDTHLSLMDLTSELLLILNWVYSSTKRKAVLDKERRRKRRKQLLKITSTQEDKRRKKDEEEVDLECEGGGGGGVLGAPQNTRRGRDERG